jgi:hypothetical protein
LIVIRAKTNLSINGFPRVENDLTDVENDLTGVENDLIRVENGFTIM